MIFEIKLKNTKSIRHLHWAIIFIASRIKIFLTIKVMRVWIVLKLENINKFIDSKLKTVIPMQDGSDSLVQGENCHICEKPFQEGDNPVRDHCHFTGKFRDWAHSSCNLNYKNSFVVPVVLHNLSNYDSHLLIRDIAQVSPGKITLLAKNKEQYISFTKHISESLVKFRFIDSFRFLASSLDQLAAILTRDDFKMLKSEFSHLNEDLDVLKETSLPELSKFYNKLNDAQILEADYALAKTDWRAFNIENLSQYTQLYLKTDVLLLADISENFRDRCLKTYGLDPAYYYTLPGYTWD
ncbi:hypothetical protein NQ315_012319 [Exocentrus adspersus]|uniref:DNA-directed DNA polymerase n=1 Tax=Exocentrus adspersus TaxID=1586481 RepID=A0AAV8VC96_9CUCU|nr:hypothetical protein NQ315_012319 [Exocentrus adspersus]